MTGLTIGAASFPAAAQARIIVDSSDAQGSSPAQVVTLPALQQASPGAQSQFEWGDAGIGAGGALLLVGIGSGTAVAVRRRSGALTG